MAEAVKIADPTILNVPATELTAGGKNIVPDTTEETDRKTQGQRRINLIWECTQAVIAFSVTIAIIYTEINGRQSERLGQAFTTIMLLYFVRMNHIKVGGVGGTDTR